MTKTNYGLSLKFFMYSSSVHVYVQPGQDFEHASSRVRVLKSYNILKPLMWIISDNSLATPFVPSPSCSQALESSSIPAGLNW